MTANPSCYGEFRHDQHSKAQSLQRPRVRSLMLPLGASLLALTAALVGFAAKAQDGL